MDNLCQQCGSSIPNGSPSGVCPACLIALAKVPTENGPRGAFEPPDVEDLQGRIPGVDLKSLIGYGGMGAVYRGRQLDLDRDVAVKILPQSLSEDPVFASRFRREAQALAKLAHPNIVTVFGSGVADGLCYIVMEHVQGTTLREAMSAKAIDPAAALRIVPQICEALAFAHANGIVHRDIKPENILLGVGGKVKVADFGLAKISDDDRSHTMLTQTGSRLGTLRYMAPEQLDGMAVDHRADVYSLGVVFYEMLTGQVPMGQFAMPSEKSAVDPRIDEVVMKTLRREPSERYQNVSDVEQELDSISRGGGAYGWDRQFQPRAHHVHMRPGREWKSSATLFGWPLLHVAYGYDRRTGKKLVAKGVIAMGDVAIGGLALGGVSFGIVSIGGAAAGLNALGGVAAGLQFAFGGAAVGGVATGGAAIGGIATGGAAIGGLATGGAATGYVAIGGEASGVNVLSRADGVWDPPEFADSALATFVQDPWFPWFTGLAVLCMVLGPQVLVWAMVIAGKIRARLQEIQERPMPYEVRHQLMGAITACLISTMVFPVVGVAFGRELQQNIQQITEQQMDPMPVVVQDNFIDIDPVDEVTSSTEIEE